ncbi:hypothetical protein A9K65_020570 [Mesorhizobium sp. WSM1497]|nr:hypothetical protein A9K65_020570 [Mesorhizobium sp. WSM1497]
MPVIGALGAVTSVVNTKPFTALLTPAATSLGNYWGEQTDEWVARRKAKKTRNLIHHRDRVLRLDPPDLDSDGPTERQFEYAEEWAEGAEKIEPERDKELSALWEGLLSEIYRDGDDIQEMMQALKAMERRDAILLLNTGSGWAIPRHQAEQHGLERLARIGVVERYSALRRAGQTRVQSLAILGIFAVAIGFLLPNLLGFLPMSETGKAELLRYQTILFSCVAVCTAVLAFTYTRFWGSFRLTTLGDRLKMSAQRFLNKA